MELFDVTGRAEASVHPWVRSVCRYGFLPANGMIYNAPDHCGCYPHVKLTGMNALLAPVEDRSHTPAQTTQRFHRGPAFGDVALAANRNPQSSASSSPQSANSNPRFPSWPAFRHDSMRSGIASCELPPELTRCWTTSVGGSPTAVTVAGGRVCLSVPDHCLVSCLDVATGRRLWDFAVDSRVDSPPTHHHGTVLFGCANGNVYCLRASDGELVWRFDAAPRRRLIMIDGKIESAWPVHGSVVVENGKVFITSGRSDYLDDGFAIWILDAATGQVQTHHTRDGRDVEFLGMRLGTQALPGVKRDLLVSDGASLFMREECIFAQVLGESQGTPFLSNKAGFLDSSFFNRTSQWVLGSQRLGDYAVADAAEAYCWRLYSKRLSGDHGFFQPGTGSYTLSAYRSPITDAGASRRKKTRQKPPSWERKFPVVVRALVKAGSTLCAAGMPDAVPQNDPWQFYEGRGPGVLVLVDAHDGATLVEHTLASAPVFHGLAAAEERLFVSCRNGDIICFGALASP
jgi:hypothetical protein